MGYENNISSEWIKLKNCYQDVNFFFYKDNRVNKKYVPSIYFYLLKTHFKENPELTNELLFLHDSDIIFTKKPNLEWVKKSDVWYMSNTNSYINYDYIQQKGNFIYENMCEIIGIDKLIPKLFNNHSGGAQYIINGEGYDFWDKVERDSITLYDFFSKEEKNYKKKHENDYPIQKWTAGMWSLLWNSWVSGHPSEIRKELDFGWSTNHISDIDKYWILHNAGVTTSKDGLFYKAEYMNKLPYNLNLNIKEDRASKKYYEEIQKTEKKSCLI